MRGSQQLLYIQCSWIFVLCCHFDKSRVSVKHHSPHPNSVWKCMLIVKPSFPVCFCRQMHDTCSVMLMWFAIRSDWAQQEGHVLFFFFFGRVKASLDINRQMYSISGKRCTSCQKLPLVINSFSKIQTQGMALLSLILLSADSSQKASAVSLYPTPKHSLQ